MLIRRYQAPEGADEGGGGAAPTPAEDVAPAAPAPPPEPAPPPIAAKVVEKPAVPVVGDANAEWERARSAADKIELKLQRGIERDRIRLLRRLGADPARISDDDLLLLAPKVDADEPAGVAALHAWKTSRPGLFIRAQAGPQETLATIQQTIVADKKLTVDARARKLRMTQRLLGGES